MKLTAFTVTLLFAMAAPLAQTNHPATPRAQMSKQSMQKLKSEDVRAVSPALERYNQNRLLGEVWKRPGLSTRDRGLITVAALVARNQTAEMAFYMNLALDSGVKPREIGELITHLAFYSGWGNAMSAVAVAKEVFAQRGIKPDELPPAAGELLAIDEAAEAQRAARVEKDAGPVSPGLVQYTGEVLFHDLWLRPSLAPRDRSLVTVTALIAAGQVAQMPFHLGKAMDNGLTKGEASRFFLTWPSMWAGPTCSRPCQWPRACSTLVPTEPTSATHMILLPIMAAGFVGFLVVGLALPVLPLHVHGTLGMSPFVVGLVTGCQFVAALVTRMWAGNYADTKGAKRAVVAGLLAATIAGLLYLASLALLQSPLASVTVLLLGRALLGGGESFIITGALGWGVALADRNAPAR